MSFAAQGLPPPPGMREPAPTKRRRTLLPALGVLGLLVVLSSGGFVAAGAVDADAVPPQEVAPGVIVTPAPDWHVGERVQGRGVRWLRLTSGAGNLDVFAGGFQGTPEELLETHRRTILEPDARQLRMAGERERVRHPSGPEGVRAHYVGVFGERSQAIEGEITVFVTESGTGVVFDGWSAQGGLDIVLEDVHEMIRTAELG